MSTYRSLVLAGSLFVFTMAANAQTTPQPVDMPVMAA